MNVATRFSGTWVFRAQQDMTQLGVGPYMEPISKIEGARIQPDSFLKQQDELSALDLTEKGSPEGKNLAQYQQLTQQRALKAGDIVTVSVPDSKDNVLLRLLDSIPLELQSFTKHHPLVSPHPTDPKKDASPRRPR
jgi:hypothetical protein